MEDLSKVPVFVLCGGLGTRFREETDLKPKPMITIGRRPILWHIMRKYSRHGFKSFVLCVGYRSEMIKSYFLNYAALHSDFTVDLMSDKLTLHSIDHDQDWTVTLAYTGELTMTGTRVARAAQRYLGNAEHFAVTYGDGLTDANLDAECQFHREHGQIGTVLGINPPSRFGELASDESVVTTFDEKPDISDHWINGGYFFFRRSFLEYLSPDEDWALERQPLTKLAADGQLRVFKHRGFWQCMDTQRDRELLEDLWENDQAPWLA